MLGTIERIKNAVLFKCNALNDKIISDELVTIIDSCVYHLAEDIVSLTSDFGFNEDKIRDRINELIKQSLVKKIKRKLFIDSLALQITNDAFIEDYVYEKIKIKDIKKNYIKELENNKNTNQLNMTEDLDITEYYDVVTDYVNTDIIKVIEENNTLVKNVMNVIDNSKKELEEKLIDLINNADEKYLNILLDELSDEEKPDTSEDKEEKGGVLMTESIKDIVLDEKENNDFDKYDDMTLFNKVLLSLNTKEETLQRRENKIEERRRNVEERLESTNDNIEANIKRENELSKRKLKLNDKEVKLNAKLSETEVIFLNIKPLLKGLNSIKSSSIGGGDDE